MYITTYLCTEICSEELRKHITILPRKRNKKGVHAGNNYGFISACQIWMEVF